MLYNLVRKDYDKLS